MYQQCSKCVMDTTASEITFRDGVCSFCDIAQRELAMAESVKHLLPYIVDEIKDQHEKYDCLIGLSGGADSSMVLHWAVQQGLKPLCYSVDNGWNNKIADENIMRMVEKLKVPFYRYTIDLDKYHKLQAAFMMAGVPNIEIPTDHILMATTYEMAAKNNIKWVLSGGNIATESIMPASWGYSARDLKHIKSIYKMYMKEKLTGLPLCSLLMFNIYKWWYGITIFYPLDFLDYNRQQTIELLEKEYGWKDYGEKHCESQWTQWFQNYYLYEKFGFDKRKAHLSSMINSGQLTREQALYELTKVPEYPKLGIEGFAKKWPAVGHEYYPKDEKLFNFIGKIVKFIRRWS